MIETNTEMTDEELAQPGVLEALVEEIKERALLSTSYKQERDDAKTDTKRQHFHKKLVRNNEEAADLIAALERIISAREKNGTTDNAEGDAKASSASEESSN